MYVKSKIDFKKYSKINEYQEIISFYDIISKLTKGDDTGLKPSDYVINSYILKKINKALSDSESILYAIKNLDHETIDSIKSLIKQQDHSIQFNLIVLDDEELDSNVSSKFCNVFYLEND
jgi:hypothetical protein